VSLASGLVVGSSCAPSGIDVQGEGEAEGEGEGEGEGETTPPLRVLVDGVDVGDVDFGAVAAALPGQEGGVVDRTITLLPTDPTTSVTLYTEPPILVAGLDTSAWSVLQQPASTVRPGGATFPVRFAPTTTGALRGAIVLAHGTRASERIVVALRGTGEGPTRLPGVRCATYDGTFDALPDFTTLSPSSTTLEPALAVPTARLRTDFFGALFLGVLDVPTAGDWTFHVTSDDGSRVIVDGAVVVDNDGLHAPLTVENTVALAAGPHALEVQFFEKTGGEVLTIEWTGPGHSREVIPATALSVNTTDR
jgi:hypothetical protein